jgi:hypothetical protein
MRAMKIKDRNAFTAKEIRKNLSFRVEGLEKELGEQADTLLRPYEIWRVC